MPVTAAIAGSCGKGERLAGRRLGDLSVLTWSQTVGSQRRHGATESQRGKTEKSTFLFFRWNWRLSRRPGVRVAASWRILKNTNLVIRATRRTGWCVTSSSVMPNLEMIVGGVRRETAKGQDTGDIPPLPTV